MKLLIFTRYPRPGEVKTRLIPALGPEGAAKLHQGLVEHTLQQAQAWKNRLIQLSQNSEPTNMPAVEVWFSGGTISQMQAWLGTEFSYHHQSEGDLGARITTAVNAHFSANPKTPAPVLVIGTDCPGLTPHLLSAALDSLKTCPLVLGPAWDGGYYLIGLSRWVPELFTEINWGSDQVFQQTLAKATQQGLAWQRLPELPDIDRPADLTLLNSGKFGDFSALLG